jgi:isopenicillin N synthase-like dioxygenase
MFVACSCQVFSRDGSWTPVTPASQQLVVLVGHTLSWATAGQLQATEHRVVLPSSASSGNNSSVAAPRLSLAFKLHAAPDAVFAPAAITGIPSKELDSR